MTIETVKSVCETYSKKIESFALAPKQVDDESELEAEDGIAHARWMCDEIASGKYDDNIEKVMRWIGFIQGVLWSQGIYTIAEMKEHNR